MVIAVINTKHLSQSSTACVVGEIVTVDTIFLVCAWKFIFWLRIVFRQGHARALRSPFLAFSLVHISHFGLIFC